MSDDDRFDLPPKQESPRLTESERRDLFQVFETLAKMTKNVSQALYLDETDVHRDNVRRHVFDARAEIRQLNLLLIPLVDHFDRPKP